MNSIKLGVLVGLAGALAAPGVAAQQARTPVLQEIIVTAQKRVESAQEVPAALTVLDADALERAAIYTIEGVVARTPGFTMNRFNIAEPQLYIRGVGSSSDSAAGDPTVGVFLDEVYVGRISGASFDLFDLERIEVLRGPQGTLYGRNTSGGAVNVITRKPTRDFEALVQVGAGNYASREARALLNGALGPAGAARVVVSHRENEGYSRNMVTGQRLANDNNTSLRAQYLLDGGPTRLLLGFDYSEDDTKGNARVPFPVFDDLAISALIRALYPAGTSIRLSTSDPASFQRRRIRGMTFRAEHDADYGTWTLLLGHRETDVRWYEDLSGLRPSPPWVLFNEDRAEEHANQYSAEARLSSSPASRLEWVLGAYAFGEDVDRTESFVTRFTPLPIAGGDVTFVQDAQSDSYALFGQLGYPVTDRFKITGGVRLTRDQKDVVQVAINNDPSDTTPGIPLFPGSTYNIAASEEWDSFTGRLSFEYTSAGGQLFYAAANRGFKSGIFPSQNNVVQNVGMPTPPEKVMAYEVGAKTEWADRRVRANVALFRMNYEDLQLFRLDPQLRLITFTEDAIIDGVELELAAALTEGFRIGANYAWLDAEVDGGSNNGNKLQRAPESRYGVFADASWQAGPGTLAARAEYQWTDDFFTEVPNNRASFIGSYGMVDARLSYTFDSSGLEIAAWGKNLTDEEYASHIIPFLGNGFALFGPPRTYGLQVTWRSR